MKYLIIAALSLFSGIASAQDCPVKGQGGVCLTKDQKEDVQKAIAELDSIHNSVMSVALEPIVIIRDWQNRVYINGQEGKPLKLNVKIGKTVDRDAEVKLPIQVFFREAPPPPMFRLRIRAQIGLLSTPLFKSFGDSSALKDSMDGGIGWDFFGIYGLNLAAYTGVRSSGFQLGYDITKNFGICGGYNFLYDGFGGTGSLQTYFSFN